MFNQFEDKGQLAQVLQRRLNMTGASPAPSVAPELFPVLAYENDRPEWGYYKGERICSKQVSQAAVAGQFSAVQLYLPSTSSEIAVIESIELIAAGNVLISRGVGIGGGIGGWVAQTTATRDFRWGGQSTSLVLEGVTGVAAPSRFPTLGQLATAGVAYNAPIVIAPGTALMIVGAAVNTAILCNVTWRERPAMTSELG